jgi:hypothetical protein
MRGSVSLGSVFFVPEHRPVTPPFHPSAVGVSSFDPLAGALIRFWLRFTPEFQISVVMLSSPLALAGQLSDVGARRGLTLVGSGFVGNAQPQELALLPCHKTHFNRALVIATGTVGSYHSAVSYCLAVVTEDVMLFPPSDCGSHQRAQVRVPRSCVNL